MSTLTYESYRIEGDDADNEGDAEVDLTSPSWGWR